jgi:hypothetical protein
VIPTLVYHAIYDVTGRPAACLGDYGADTSDAAVQKLGNRIAEHIAAWVAPNTYANNPDNNVSSSNSDSSRDSVQRVLSDWQQWVDWSATLEIRATGQRVRPVRLNTDGTLRVRDEASGAEQTLAAEYLY